MQPMLMLLRSYLPPKLLPIFILSLMCHYAHAYTGAQNDHPVTISGNTTLRSVFKAIKQQTGFAVMYSTAATGLDQDEKVNVNFKEAPLDDVLSFLLKGKELEWKYSDDVLVIHKKASITPEKKTDADSTVTPTMITGKVTDASGAPLPGASIQVKGTNHGTATDANGNFALEKVSIGSTLVINSIGYEKREITVSGKRILMQLNTQALQLDEGVAIAYGTTTQRFSTGNIGTVKAKDIEKQPVSNPLLALQGRVPGLFITQNTGLSGGGVTVRIQGQNSIQSGNDPLYIIDGVPVGSQLQSTGIDAILGNSGDVAVGAVPTAGNPLNYLNPSDIESISVLKDADATAIYGSRAANGAILITTKKGKAGPVRLNLDLQQGWGQVARQIKMMNTQQYLAMRHEAFRNDGITSIPANNYDLTFWDTTRYTNWQQELIGHTAQYTNLNGSFSGGTELLQYMVGGTYHRETTVFPGPKDLADQKAAVHFNINNVSANRKFHLQLSGNYMIDHNRLPGIDLTTRAVQTEPNAPALYTPDGGLNWEPNAAGRSTWSNPLLNLFKKYTNKSNNLIANLSLGYHILPGLDLSSSMGYTNMYTNDFSIFPLEAIRPESRPFAQRSAYFGNRNANSWIIEPQLNYQHQWRKGKIEMLLGSSVQQSSSSSASFVGIGQNSDLVLRDIKTAPVLSVTSSRFVQYKYNAAFGRINYNWDSKYVLNLTARRDGSSRFGKVNKFHTFGAVGAAWIFSNEDLIRKWLPVLSFGKLRSSYGITGNDQLADYNYLSLYDQYITPILYQNTIGLQPIGLSNPYLQWEATKKWQTGLELGFMDNRILFNITYVRNRSSNQLTPYALPTITGFPSITRNFPATVQNTSWEFSLNTTNIDKKDLGWTSNVNLTIPRNKLVAFPGLSTSAYANILIIGQPLGIAKAFSFRNVDPEIGAYTFTDKDGKATSAPNLLTDATILINTAPKLYGGWQNNVRFKGFSLDLLFQYVWQTGANTLFNNRSVISPGGFINGSSNQPLTVLDHWKAPGDRAPVMRYTTDIFGNLSLLSYANSSDATYGDASYVRLKNLSFSWQLPVQWISAVHGQYCRIYLQGQNLLTFTAYKGIDPENQSVGSLPPLRVITAGIQVGF